MVEVSNRVGGAPSSVQNTGTRENRATVAGNRTAGRQPTPNGPRGQRMLSPDTPLDQLDRSAPRGTYLDLLV